MRIRTTRVPFAEIVGPDAKELEFDPATDYLVLRSIYALPIGEVRDIVDRLRTTTPGSTADEAAATYLDVLDRTVVEWHLVGEAGPVAQPKSLADLEALPGAIRGALLPFLGEFRGRPDPTPAE